MEMIRSSPIAGSWYAGTRDKLKEQIKELFGNPEFGYGIVPEFDPGDKPKETLVGVISPHAGLAYSGVVATHAYATLMRHIGSLDIAIVIGPNHIGIGPDISIPAGGIWKFPMGDLEVSTEVINYIKTIDLGEIEGLLEFENSAHIQEHSIDIQFPFLQFLYGSDFEILPICLRQQNRTPVATGLAEMINKIINEFEHKSIAIVGSTDLSHEYDIKLVESNDKKFIDAIETTDTNRVEEVRKEFNITSCGFGSILTLLELGHIRSNKPQVGSLKYGNSGRITGKTSGYCVGYYAGKILE